MAPPKPESGKSRPRPKTASGKLAGKSVGKSVGKFARRSGDGSRPAEKPRGRGFAAAAAAAKSPLRLAAAKRGIAETRLLTHWPDIAGERLAAISRPCRVKHRGGLALGGVLELEVEGSRLSEIEHELAQLCERVNAFYGYSAIVDIRLLRATAPLPPPARKTRKRQARAEDLPEAQQAALRGLTGAIQDDALRDALSRLGANVLSRRRATAKEPEPGARR